MTAPSFCSQNCPSRHKNGVQTLWKIFTLSALKCRLKRLTVTLSYTLVKSKAMSKLIKTFSSLMQSDKPANGLHRVPHVVLRLTQLWNQQASQAVSGCAYLDDNGLWWPLCVALRAHTTWVASNHVLAEARQPLPLAKTSWSGQSSSSLRPLWCSCPVSCTLVPSIFHKISTSLPQFLTD
jgi:hypothetical protein